MCCTVPKVVGRRRIVALFAAVTSCSLHRAGLAEKDVLDSAVDARPIDSSPDDTIEVEAEADVTSTSCADGVANGDESDVDCGGRCPACTDGRRCRGSGDCASRSCEAGACAPSTCKDGIRNGGETDFDCGGPDCPRCALGQGCSKGDDCETGACAAAKCAPPTSCKEWKSASPSRSSGPLLIDPDGPSIGKPPFVAYCDLVTDGGGWTFFAHVNEDYSGWKLFELDTGTYREDRADDATTYSVGSSLLPFISHTSAMLVLDGLDPVVASAARKVIVFSYPVGTAAFSRGPVPCSATSPTPFNYRLTLTGAFAATGLVEPCNLSQWYTHVSGSPTFLTHFNGTGPYGSFWGSGMGGNDSWNHDGWWYVR